MAEGGGHLGYEDPYLDDGIDNDGGDPHNTTKPFVPRAGFTSTPYVPEHIPLGTFQQEHSGMPDTSYEEEETSFGGERTPLIEEDPDAEIERSLKDLRRNSSTGLYDFSKYPGVENPLTEVVKRQELERAKRTIKARFPNVDFNKLGPIRYSTKKPMEIVVVGPKGGETFLFKKDGGFLKQALNKTFVKKALGKGAEEIIAEGQASIKEQRQRLVEAEKQQRLAEKIDAEINKNLQEMENIKMQTEKTQKKIEAIQEEHGTNLEMDAEAQRLKQLKKNHQTEYENKKKEVAALEKQAKNKQKAEEKVSRERAKLDEIVKKRNLIEERLISTKPLDDLNAREAELRQQNAEDQAIIDAADTSPSEREAARDRQNRRKNRRACAIAAEDR